MTDFTDFEFDRERLQEALIEALREAEAQLEILLSASPEFPVQAAGQAFTDAGSALHEMFVGLHGAQVYRAQQNIAGFQAALEQVRAFIGVDEDNGAQLRPSERWKVVR